MEPILIRGIIYIFGSLVLGLLGYRIYQHYRKERGYVSKLFTYAIFISSLHLFVFGTINMLLLFFLPFASEILSVRFIVFHIINAFLFAILFKLFLFLRSSTIPSNKGFFAVLFTWGIIEVLNLLFFWTPVYLKEGVMILGEHPLIAGLRILVTGGVLLPLGVTFLQKVKGATKIVKVRSIGFGIVSISGFIYFLLEEILMGRMFAEKMVSSIINGLLALVFLSILVILLVKKEKVAKIISSEKIGPGEPKTS